MRRMRITTTCLLLKLCSWTAALAPLATIIGTSVIRRLPQYRPSGFLQALTLAQEVPLPGQSDGHCGWREVPICARCAVDAGRATPTEKEAAGNLVRGESIISLNGVASEAECVAIVAACSHAPTEFRTSWTAAGRPAPEMVRFPSNAAVARALKQSSNQAAALAEEMNATGGWPGSIPAEVDSVCAAVLRRVLARIDAQLPTLVQQLFCGANGTRARNLAELYAKDGLLWASREPAVNVYAMNGKFLAHTDGHALTVLVPLSPPESFTGGGTGFWRQESRGHRVELPTIVLKPQAGTALLFGGHVSHSGVPVLSGERAVLVASFTLKLN